MVDIFENFKDTCFKIYNLDVAYFNILPRYRFSCMLKYTSIKHELLSDDDMLFGKNIRDGLTQAIIWYGKGKQLRDSRFQCKKYRNLFISWCNKIVIKMEKHGSGKKMKVIPNMHSWKSRNLSLKNRKNRKN